MSQKCCAKCFRSICDNQNKVCVFLLPQDQIERERWLGAIPRVNTPGKPLFVNEMYLAFDYETVDIRVKVRPCNPTSVFDYMPLPIPQTTPKTTNKTFASVRNVQNV